MNFSLRTISLLLLITTTLLALFAYDKGIYKTYTIDLTRQTQMGFNTDLSQGGETTAEISYTDEGIVLNCSISLEYQWPYCELKIHLAERADQGAFDYAQGVDLSSYTEVFINISTQGKNNDQIRFYMRNFNPAYTNLNSDGNSLKINEVQYTPNEYPNGKYIPIKDFNVVSWWLQARDIPLELRGVEISNVPLLTIASGGLVDEGEMTIIVKELYFRYNLISKENILFAVIAMWFFSAIIVLLLQLKSFHYRLNYSKNQQRKLSEVMHALKLEKVQLEKLAKRDALTGLRNRVGLSKYLIEGEEKAQDHNIPFSLIFVDIDFFKKINDQHGHNVGDQLLIQFGRSISENIRQQDKLARWGGEEFIILCMDTQQDKAVTLAEKLCKLLADKPLLDGITITASFGIAQLHKDESTTSFLERADNALYKAKTNGRNQVQAAD
ncbi:GGDEF domain-containing protein [Psychromonas hadalis]|uniref:GGDEF domain-containing protein n=1 Tax=Psychromonas hadalis TaxID=211669 RepID=UPI0003B6BD27|nr:GGDEF domain-containing protein [Psychromonas hadalis]